MRTLAFLDEVRPATRASWEAVFHHIERDHVESDPSHWATFRRSIATVGILTPVVLLWIPDRRPRLINGHHRVWGAVLEGLEAIPTLRFDRLPAAYHAAYRQAHAEQGWKASNGATLPVGG